MWRVRAVATGTVRWSLDTAHHGFDTMGPCVIAPESGKVKGFEKQKGRVRPLRAARFAPGAGGRSRSRVLAASAAAAPGTRQQRAGRAGAASSEIMIL